MEFGTLDDGQHAISNGQTLGSWRRVRRKIGVNGSVNGVFGGGWLRDGSVDGCLRGCMLAYHFAYISKCIDSDGS